MLIAYHVIISMDFVLINHNLNPIGPANILETVIRRSLFFRQVNRIIKFLPIYTVYWEKFIILLTCQFEFVYII